MSLKDLTRDLHTEAENTEFAKKLVSGNITVKEYTAYLYQMLLIYQPIEMGCEQLGIFEILPGLQRVSKIIDDHRELERQIPDRLSWVPSTIEYHNYLLELIRDNDRKHLIKAHMYVRHMGDLYGGQMISKSVPGGGKFYQFENADQLKTKIRELMTDDLGNEARVAFEWNIKIMKELYESSLENAD